MHFFLILPLIIISTAFNHFVPSASFAWLHGTWESKRPNGSTRLEVWHTNDDGSLDGQGLKVNGPDTIMLEAIQIVEKDCKTRYIPTVPDQNDAKPVSFELVRAEGFYFVFENMKHDFPQRIIYHMKPAANSLTYQPSRGDSLLVTLEAAAHKNISFHFTRK